MFNLDTNLIILTIFIYSKLNLFCVVFKHEPKMKDINLPDSVKDVLQQTSEIANYLWQREWIERNGGNISVDLTDHFEGVSIPSHVTYVKKDFPKEAANMFLYITGASCYLRRLTDSIEKVSCIMHINNTADGYAILWGGKKQNFTPTSEISSHLTIHIFNRSQNIGNKVVLHAHPSELIVLSHHEIFHDEQKLNHSIWKMCPEVRVYVPRGIHCTPYAITQSDNLAQMTIDAFKTRDVALWEKHGATVTAPTIEEAWDFMDVANKGAKLLLMAWASGFEPEGISDKEIEALEKLFNL